MEMIMDPTAYASNIRSRCLDQMHINLECDLNKQINSESLIVSQATVSLR